MNRVICPKCGKRLKYPDNMAGKAAKCTKCDKSFLLPIPVTPPAQADDRAEEEKENALEALLSELQGDKQQAENSTESTLEQKLLGLLYYRYPDRCARCLEEHPKCHHRVRQESTLQYYKRITSVNVPVCNYCKRIIRSVTAIIVCIVIAVLASLATVGYSYYSYLGLIGGLAVGATVFAALFENQTIPGVTDFVWWEDRDTTSNALQLHFKDEEYQTEFLKLNNLSS